MTSLVGLCLGLLSGKSLESAFVKATGKLELTCDTVLCGFAMLTR
jgi:hypothetical protein